MSLLKRVTSEAVAEPPPETFSQCLVAGDLIFVSGQLGVGADGGGSMEQQARTAFTKLKYVLEAAGATMDDVARLTIFVTDITKRAEISAVRRTFFSGDFPTSTLVEVAALAGSGALVEIDAIAVHRRSDVR